MCCIKITLVLFASYCYIPSQFIAYCEANTLLLDLIKVINSLQMILLYKTLLHFVYTLFNIVFYFAVSESILLEKKI